MKNKGQLTLEIAILLMLSINIFLYVTIPVKWVAQRGVESIGVSALAVKAVDSIVQKADMVGISGYGAKGSIQVPISDLFKVFSCNNKNLSLEFDYYNTTYFDTNQVFGGQDITIKKNRIYSVLSDFWLSCNFTELNLMDSSACVCFENIGNRINITAVNSFGAECSTCSVTPPVCGDAKKQFTEACDLSTGTDSCDLGEACGNDCKCNQCYTITSPGRCRIDFDSCKCLNNALVSGECSNEITLAVSITRGFDSDGNCIVIN